jgi:DNA-binding NtrC family response regulator
MNILFMDDDSIRLARFRGMMVGNHVLVSCETARDCVSNLTRSWDVVFLDHDLGIGNGTGHDVAKWIAENKPTIGKIVLHSVNPAGSANMQSLLKNDYDLFVCPFIHFSHKTVAALLCEDEE